MPLIITAEKWSALRERMAQLGIQESDLRETFVRGSGSGGQKVNKTSSCVQLLHEPTGTEVRCQQERSQMGNRYIARMMLCNHVERGRVEKVAKERHEREKVRRQNRGLSRGAKRRRIANRKKRSLLKQSRRKPTVE